jgi:predicted transcriptional regulator
MALYEKRKLAREMRRNGESIREIGRILEVSKGTISKWCSDIELTEEQIKILSVRGYGASLKGRMIGVKMNKQKKLDAIKKADEQGREIIQSIDSQEKILIATALYWAEGVKSQFHAFQFTNSDPIMILFMKSFLLDFGIKKDDIVITIQINEIHKSRIETVLNFWKDLLEFNSNQLTKPCFIKAKIEKVYENYDSYYGVCRLQVRKSTNLKYRILGLIKSLKQQLSA